MFRLQGVRAIYCLDNKVLKSLSIRDRMCPGKKVSVIIRYRGKTKSVIIRCLGSNESVTIKCPIMKIFRIIKYLVGEVTGQ